MEEIVTGEAVVLDLPYARFPTRMLAFLIDMLVQLLMLIIIGALVAAGAGSHSLDSAAVAALLVTGFVIVIVGYPAAFETLSRGRTLGKLALGLRVVGDDGGPERFRQALVRALAGSVECWALIGVPALVTAMLSARGKRLGDIFAGTFVVRERAPRPAGGAYSAGAYGIPRELPAANPALRGWAAALDLSCLPEPVAAAAASYVSRYWQLNAPERDELGRQLAADIAARVAPAPPPGLPAVDYLHIVLTERRHREFARMQAARMAGQPPVRPASRPPHRPPPEDSPRRCNRRRIAWTSKWCGHENGQIVVISSEMCPTLFSPQRWAGLQVSGLVAAVGKRAMRAGGGLLERDTVVASAAELVDRVGSGGSGALFLMGEAGLGKTSVLAQACQRAAEEGLTVGVGRGHPMENGLPFGVLVQAFDGVGGRELLSEDAVRSRSAADWPARYYRVLRWLRDRTGDRMFLAIDDLHWADADSVALVSFLCRRMDQVPFGLIASLRPWPARARDTVTQLMHEGHGSVLRLRPLTEQAAGSLLQARLGRQVPVAARRRAFELSAGNPLLLEQLAVAMGKGADAPAADISSAASGQGVLLSRFAGLADAGMRCAQAAAVLGSGFLPAVAAEVAGLGGADTDAAIEELARTGLIEQRPGAAAEFVHPLFRQALYDDLPGPVRCRLHARAFAALHARGLDGQAAEHAVQADLSGDPEAAAVLEAAGRAARRAGAMATAVRWLDMAAAMAGDRASIRLMMDRAEAHLVTGGAGIAADAYQALLTRDDVGPKTRLEILWMLARAQATAGQHDVAAATFEHAARLATGSDPATGVEILLDAAYCAWLSGGAASALALAGRARDLAGTTGEAVQARADASWAEYAVSCGHADGIAAAEAAVASWGATRDVLLSVEKTARRGGWGTANSLASCALGVEQLPVAERAFSIVRAAAEDAGVPWAAAGLAVGHTYALFRIGRLDQALAAANAAVSMTELVPLMDGYANAALALISLYVGKLDESALLCQRAEAAAAGRGHLLAQMFLCDTLGHRRLREGAVTEACAAYSRLEDIRAQTGIQEPCLPNWPRHAVNAYLAAGRTGDAERVLAWLDQITPRLPCKFPRIAAATGHARLAELNRDYAGAEALYQSALALHSQANLPIEHCETLLAYGGFLRKAGQAARARPVLAQAAQIAEQTGARWLAGLAHDELKVAGGRLRRRVEPRTLSTQEERVAALVATGTTNAGVARQLNLSVSTVETHLERIYAKLGIHNRYQLIAMRAAGRQPEP